MPVTVDQFHHMMETGIIREGDPIELVDGLLVLKDRNAPGGVEGMSSPRHTSCISRLEKLLRAVEPLGFLGRMQAPVRLEQFQEPQPDAAVVQGGVDDFTQRHPGPEDLAVVIEVSLSSLNYDRTTRLAIYAAAGIARYWIVNLVDDVIEIYSQPNRVKQTYGEKTVYGRGDVIILALHGDSFIPIAVSDVIPGGNAH